LSALLVLSLGKISPRTGRTHHRRSGKVWVIIIIFDLHMHCRWLYALFVGIDANFRLKRKVVSGDIVDPGLSKGWAYFVNEKEYKAYLDENKGRNQEVMLIHSE